VTALEKVLDALEATEAALWRAVDSEGDGSWAGSLKSQW
jgi:hypothetical protein